MPPDSAEEKKSPELLSLEATRDNLKKSIEAREGTENTNAEFQIGTDQEKARLDEIEARIKEIGKPAKKRPE